MYLYRNINSKLITKTVTVLNSLPSNLLIDKEADQQLLKNGFIVLPFLDEKELVEFRELYKKWHPTHPKEFYKSYFDSRLEYKQEVEHQIIQKFQDKMQTVFKNYTAFGGMFVVKPPLEKGHFPAHQDWSFVDERKYWSLNMWCPLEDVNDTNGNIQVLRGSHQFNRTIRGFSTPDLYREHETLVLDNMESVPMKAGEAIFFFHGLLHGSTLNSTENSRVSLGLTLTPKQAKLQFHYLDESEGKKELLKYVTSPEFYIDYAAKRGAKPDLRATNDNFKFVPFDREDLIQKIKAVNGHVILPESTDTKSAPKWWQKLFG